MMRLLQEGARNIGLTLSSRHVALFEAFYRELTSWSERFNLTAIRGYEEVQRKHFLDSLNCLLALPRGGANETIPNAVPLQLESRSIWCMDVGSGAGFPGLPLKIMLPEAKMTLIEAASKKVAFLKYVTNVLGLENVEILHARAEDVAHMPEHRERYDLVVSRAVAHLTVLCEYCLPFCRICGRMIAPKGEDAEQEAQEAQKAIELLGGRLVTVKPVSLPSAPSSPDEGGAHGDETRHYLVAVDKVTRTPDRYPRRVGIPSKRPLC